MKAAYSQKETRLVLTHCIVIIIITIKLLHLIGEKVKKMAE